jgi:hypothetical protein
MPDEPNVIPPIRLLRWLLLAILIAAGTALYFRHGVRLPAFGSTTLAADTTR